MWAATPSNKEPRASTSVGQSECSIPCNYTESNGSVSNNAEKVGGSGPNAVQAYSNVPGYCGQPTKEDAITPSTYGAWSSGLFQSLAHDFHLLHIDLNTYK